ncbi:MAG: endonuclease domain-containing protein [Actinomycetota bacterium]|nr:endonuclease domain-containing protein [Actinomycetota bacterium]
MRKLIDQRRNHEDTESGLEAKVGRALRLGRLPAPMRQHKIFSDEGFVARVDFAYPEAKLAVEAQSYKHHQGRKAWFRDMERDRALRALGWEVVYMTEEDLRDRRGETIEQIRGLLRKRAPQLLLAL